MDNWNEEAQQTEIEKRETCDYVLYVITPKMKGVYSIAEVVEDSIKRPNKTLFCYLNNYDNLTFDEHQIKSLEMTKLMIENNGAKTFNNIYDIVTYLNEKGAQY